MTLEKTPGNTAIIGKTGSGKTLLMTVMQQLMQKYRNPATFAPSATIKRLTTVYFDKDRAADGDPPGGRALFPYPYRRAHRLQPVCAGANCRNISFIKRLVRMLCRRNGKPLDPRDEERISAAVDTIMLDYPPEYRRPDHPAAGSAAGAADHDARTNGLRIRLKQWAQGASSAGCLITRPILSPSAMSITGIDGTN
jgi:type IV secretion system protein VirB4